MNYDKIGKFISSLRKEKGWTQEELAEKLIVDRSNLSKWERGIYVPSTEILLKLQELFDVSINEIVYGERKNKDNNEKISMIPIEVMKEGNKKIKKIKRLLVVAIIIIILLSVLFFSYYFISNYNSIKVYKISGQNGELIVKDGIMIVSKEKSYIKLGNITNLTDENIIKARLYYKKNNKEYNIFTGGKEDTELLFTNKFNYNELYKYNDVRYITKGLFLEITLSNKNKYIIELYLQKDFANNSIFNNKNILPISDKDNNVNIIDDNLISNYIKENFEYDVKTNEYIRKSKIDNIEIVERYVQKINMYFVMKSYKDFDEEFDYSFNTNELSYAKIFKNDKMVTFTYNIDNNKCIFGDCDKKIINEFKNKYLGKIIK